MPLAGRAARPGLPSKSIETPMANRGCASIAAGASNEDWAMRVSGVNARTHSLGTSTRGCRCTSESVIPRWRNWKGGTSRGVWDSAETPLVSSNSVDPVSCSKQPKNGGSSSALGGRCALWEVIARWCTSYTLQELNVHIVWQRTRQQTSVVVATLCSSSKPDVLYYAEIPTFRHDSRGYGLGCTTAAASGG
eukprot:5220121-Prymnesium_polylepis.1